MDGITSAALLVRCFGMPIKNVFFSQPDGNVFNQSMAAIKKLKGSGNLLIVTDIAVDKSNTKIVADALREFRKNNNKVIWLDHHEWDISTVKELSKYCDFIIAGQLRVCAAELVYRILCDKSNLCDELVKIAHFADFAIYPKKYEKQIWIVNHAMKILRLNESLDNPRLRKLVLLVSKGKYNDRYVVSAANRYLKRRKPHMDALLEDTKVMNIGKIRLAIGYSEKLSNQEASMELLDRFGADIAVYVPTDTGNCSIRCKSHVDKSGMLRIGGVDGSKLARALGGGGHPLASGFPLTAYGNKNFTKEDIEKAEKKIIGKAQLIYGR